MKSKLQTDVNAMAHAAGWDTDPPLRGAKPCPFCGGDPEGSYTGVFWVTCTGCGAEGPSSNTPGEALVDWNRRDAEENL